jgi:hypothetical protein
MTLEDRVAIPVLAGRLMSAQKRGRADNTQLTGRVKLAGWQPANAYFLQVRCDPNQTIRAPARNNLAELGAKTQRTR